MQELQEARNVDELSKSSSTTATTTLHQREGEIQDIMEFLKFSIMKNSKYTGTVCFNFQDKSKASDPIVYYVTVHPNRVVAVARSNSMESGSSCCVTLSIDDFLHMYSGKASAAEIAKMCYSGRVRIHNYAYRNLSQFASSFEFTTNAWNRFYQYQKSILSTEKNTKRKHLNHPATSFSSYVYKKKMISSIQLDGWYKQYIVQENIENTISVPKISAVHPVLFDRCSSCSSLQLPRLECTSCRSLRSFVRESLPYLSASPPILAMDKCFVQKAKEISSNMEDCLFVWEDKKFAMLKKSCGSFMLNSNSNNRLQMTTIQASVLENEATKSKSQCVSSFLFNRKKELIELFNRRVPGSTGYIPPHELMIREMKIQGDNILRKLNAMVSSRNTTSQVINHQSSIPWVWAEEINQPPQDILDSKLVSYRLPVPIRRSVGSCIALNVRRDIRTGHQLISGKIKSFKEELVAQEEMNPDSDYWVTHRFDPDSLPLLI